MKNCKYCLMFFVVIIICLGANCYRENVEFNPEKLPGWTKNPELNKVIGLWETRTFCWTLTGGCPVSGRSAAEWVEDGNVYLRAEDDNTNDSGCNCAALTQGTGFHDTIRGDPLTRIRTGDVEAAYILLRRSDFGAKPCSGVVGAGNIINLWLKHPDGRVWVTDFYFETEGLNAGFDERAGPHNQLITIKEGWKDWYAYQIEIKKHPEYWSKTTYPDGSEYWVIDLKALLERGSKFSGRDLSDYLWYYVDVVCEDVCAGGDVGESASWWRIHYFEIKVKLLNEIL